MAAEFWLTAAKALGAAIIAENACGLLSTACDALAFSAFAADADAIIECASSDCSDRAAELSWAALLAKLEKAEALLLIADISCGLIRRALLARLAKASALLPMAENTRGSALSACIAFLSLASCWKAEAFLANRASAAALAAALRNALALLAKLLNADAFDMIAAIALGCDARAEKALG